VSLSNNDLLLLVVLLWLAGLTVYQLKSGNLFLYNIWTLKPLVTKAKHPGWYWLAIAYQSAFVAFLFAWWLYSRPL
jgi:hypothetical protein